MKSWEKKLKLYFIKGTHLWMCFFFLFSGLLFEIKPTEHIAYASVKTKKEDANLIITNTAKNGESGLTVTAPAAGSLHAYSAVLYDGKAGRVLYEKNGYEVLPMASTTKIMTLLVVLEHTNPEDIVTVSQTAAKQPDVQLNMNTGEQYYV